MCASGPSGSGKTTLLRIIAGLEHQTSGHIRFHGTDVSRLHARDRKVGFVFQHYALFRHMTVFDNIAFGLTVLPLRERPNAAAIKAKVTKLLEMVQLAHLADRYPAQLSGGQQQRVAIARALCMDPIAMLFDEPNVGAGSGDDQRSAGRDGRTGERRNDDDGGDPRNWALPVKWRIE